MPFKLFYLLTEFYKFRVAFDSLKIDTIYSEFEINQKFADDYSKYVNSVAQKRAQVLFRGTIEDHILFEKEEDFSYMEELLTTFSTYNKYDFYPTNNLVF